jgi:hypothetical protein
MDDEFLELAKQRIQARATPAMRSKITDKNIRHHFGKLWEETIKPGFEGASGSGNTIVVPSEFMTSKERRGPNDDPAPTIEFTA